MFEVLTGRQRTRGAVLSSVNPQIAPELEQIVTRMLASNVDRRAQSAAAIAAELRSVAAILDTRTEAAEASGKVDQPGRAHTPRTTSRSSMIVGVLVAAAIAVIAWWALR